MKRFFKGLAALAICGALSFGLTNEAQAAEIDSSGKISGIETQDLREPPRPRREDDRWGRRPPPPPPRDDWKHRPPPPRDDWRREPPPPHGHRPPPPPPPRHGW